MRALRHTCGATVDFDQAEGLLDYEARFYHRESGQRIHACPACQAPLYGELAHGRLTDLEPCT